MKTSPSLTQNNKNKKGNNNNNLNISNNYVSTSNSSSSNSSNSKTNKENLKNCTKKNKAACDGGKLAVNENNNAVECSTSEDKNSNLSHCQSCQTAQEGKGENNNKKKSDKQRVRNDHSQDYGYSSEHNNGSCNTVSASSSLNSSPEGSEIACSDGFCDHEGKKSF